jgi:hypothetical protein
MGLSNRVQAVLVGVSAGFGAFGTAAAVIPDLVPVENKFQSPSHHGSRASSA